MEQLLFFRMALRLDSYVQLLALPVYRHSAHGLLAFTTVAYAIVSMAMSQNEAGLRHYLDTNLRAG